MKESDYRTCPYCGKNIEKHVSKIKNIVDTIDIEHVEGNKYGIQERWKDVYHCPKCKELFYLLHEH